MVVLYSTHCPMCTVLEKKLKAEGIEYETCTDINVMRNKKYYSVPVLEVDDKSMNFKEAVDWVNSRGE